MPQSEIARGKLAKAKVFLLAAELLDGTGLYDAIVSLSVSAAINASDGLIAARGFPVPSGQDHNMAVSVLRRSGGGEAANQLQRVLGLKNRAQYSVPNCTAADADTAFKCATRLVDKCEDEI